MVATVWQFHEKLNIEFSYDLAVLLLDTYPKSWKTGISTLPGTCTFVRVLFAKAKARSGQNVHPQINGQWSSHTVEYDVAMNKPWSPGACCSMEDSGRHHANGKKSDTKGHILCNSIYIHYSESVNL